MVDVLVRGIFGCCNMNVRQNDQPNIKVMKSISSFGPHSYQRAGTGPRSAVTSAKLGQPRKFLFFDHHLWRYGWPVQHNT